MFRESLNTRPSRVPMTITPITETMVKSIPSLPDSTAEYRFIPKPRPTTEACSRYFDTFLVNTGKGEPRVTAKAIPASRATAVGRKNDAMKRATNNIRAVH